MKQGYGSHVQAGKLADRDWQAQAGRRSSEGAVREGL